MNPRNAVLTLAVAAVLLQAVDTRAQATNPPYVGRIPPAERLKAAVKGADALDTSARRVAALVVLRGIIESLARSRPGGPTPDEKRLIEEYSEARSRSREYPDSPADQDRWLSLFTVYLRDPAFRDELLRRFFPAEVRAEYYRVTGRQPPAPPGPAGSQPNAAVKRPATAANPAAAKGALSIADYSYRLGVASEEAGNKAAAAGQFAAAVENYKQAIEYDPSLKQAYLGLGVYERLQTIDRAEAQRLYAKINEGPSPRPPAEDDNATRANPPAGGAAKQPAPGRRAGRPAKAQPGALAGGSAEDYFAQGNKYREV